MTRRRESNKMALQSYMTEELKENTVKGQSSAQNKPNNSRKSAARTSTIDRLKQRVVSYDTSGRVGEEEIEVRTILCFRRFIILLMMVFTILAGVGTYIVLQRSLTKEVESDLDIIAEDIRLLSQERVSALVRDTEVLALTLTSLAKNSKSEWPFYTEPSFPLIASNFIRATGAHLVVLSPILQNATELAQWSNYSQANQGWIQDGIQFEEVDEARLYEDYSPIHHNHDHRKLQSHDAHSHDGHGSHDSHGEGIHPTASMFPQVFRVADDGEKVVEEGSGLFVPSWQQAAAPRNPAVVNFNLLSSPHFADVFNRVVETKSPILSDLLGKSMLVWEELLNADNTHAHHNSAMNMLLCPVFKDVSTNNKEIVGILMADLNWMPLLALPTTDDKSPPVHVVVDEGCDRQFTLQVTGPDVEFLGFDDFHDREFDYLERSFLFAPDLLTIHVAGSECSYQVHVYPTEAWKEVYNTRHPVTTAVVVGGTFLLMCIIFYLYDVAVNRRGNRIVQAASRSESMLSVLYPKSVRGRLFGGNKMTDETEGTESSTSGSEVIKAQRYHLMSFLGSTPMATGVGFESKPIADLFMETTVFFADIAGFTAWSSVREPSQVFTLLETVFQAFDAIAKKTNIFKVETVGDCYVAVAGLPEPRDDHAVAMAEFARECASRFAQLVGVLEASLGPETSDLGLRIGMHSGPVTAGVLRGDKSRFQLFGDTVNTASRIESTGMRNRIQVSDETAALLKEAGKSDLLMERENMVSAKGKGKLHTYWLLTRKEEAEKNADAQLPASLPASKAASDTSLKSDTTLNASSFDQVQQSLSPKLRRLCEFNSALLIRLLKQIVAHRNASNNRQAQGGSDQTLSTVGKETSASESSSESLSQLEKEICHEHFVLNEVVDVIALPAFDPEVYKEVKSPDDIVLSQNVIDQVRLFVACIAGMYHENPFHNFHHASHVMMSVSKLLARIVGVEAILDASENVAESEHFGCSVHDHTYGITSDPMTQFSVVLAALVHDLDHLGISNAQLVKEGHELADRFKNKSVAEQNSTVLAWELLMDPRFEDFRRTIYSDEFELRRFRQLIANTVLATDIMDKELQALRKNRWKCAFDVENIETLGNAKENVNRKATIVIEHLIQASDVAHTMQHWHVYCKWNERLFEEMTLAYKAGRLGFNPAEKWYEGEIGFFDNYVIPLAKKLKDCGVFGVSSDEYLNYATENRREWEEKGRDIVAAMIEKYVGDS